MDFLWKILYYPLLWTNAFMLYFLKSSAKEKLEEPEEIEELQTSKTNDALEEYKKLINATKEEFIEQIKIEDNVN
jgi:hypothetical protein